MAKAKHTARTDGVLPDAGSDEWVEVIPEPRLLGSTARALLEKATEMGYDQQRAVVSIGNGFRVPADLLDATDLPTEPLPAPETAPTPDAALAQGAVPDAEPDQATDAPE